MRSTCRWSWALVAALLAAAGAFAQDQPDLGTVSPPLGFALPGVSTTFMFNPNYPSGTDPELDVAITNAPYGGPNPMGGQNDCYFIWKNSPWVFLWDNAAQQWYSLQLGTSNTVSNAYCQINGQGSSIDNQGNIFLSISFSSAWAGATLEFFGNAVDNTDSLSSGTWQIPEVAFQVLGPDVGPPALGTVSPSLAEIPAQQYGSELAFTASDPNGWPAINQMDIVISPNHSATNACFFVFFPYLSTIYLFDDAVQYWAPVNSSSGSAATWNSSCQLGWGSYAGADNGVGPTSVLTLSVYIPWASNLGGFDYYDEYLADQLGNSMGWGTIPGTMLVENDGSAPLPSGQVGVPYSWSTVITGGAPSYTWSVYSGALPAGLTLSQAGVLSGTPTTVGTSNFCLTFWPADLGALYVSYSLTITVPLPLAITTSSPLPPGILSVGYLLTLGAQGGHPPYSWSLLSGSAAGLTLSPAGTLSGAPTASGNFAFTAQVTDSVSASATALYSLLVVTSSFTPTPTDPATGLAMGGTKVGVFRNGNSFLLDSNGDAQYSPGVDAYFSTFFPPGGAKPGDVAVSGDWTGDTHWKVGMYRPSTGQWWLDANNDGIYDSGDYAYTFGGIAGDIPVTGDWTGLGKSCIGLFRQGFSWLLDLNCNGTFDNTPTDAFFPFGGVTNDYPVTGAWVLGQPTRVGVVRAYAPGGVVGPCTSTDASGCPFFWVLDSGNPNAGNLPANHQPQANCFALGGLFGDVFVTGDWYDTGISAAGVYRQGFWLLDLALPGAPPAQHASAPFFGYGGLTGDQPITGRNWRERRSSSTGFPRRYSRLRRPASTR
jgi:hypothetical protein